MRLICSSIADSLCLLVLHRGDQYIHLKVRIPKKVTEKQKELLREFEEESAKEGGSSSSTEKDGFTLESAWKRLKDFLGKDAPSSSNSSKEDSKK